MTPETLTVRAARDRIARFIHVTPTVTSRTIDRLAGREVVFKCESFQRTGSFKYRGATNAVELLTDAEAARGVVTHSSGNHAQALALAARNRGIAATIVMPVGSAAVKRQAVLDYGGTVVECDRSERAAVAGRIAAETGATLIPPYDHPAIIAGQGTCTLELLEAHPDLGAVVVPVGGGGLISGACLAVRELGSDAAIIGAEPALAGDAHLSLALGERQPAFPAASIADGLLTGLGELTWPIVRASVSRVFTVTEDEITSAMRLVFERLKLVIEPSAAVGVAVVLGQEFRDHDTSRRVGVVLCGGNVDLSKPYW